MDALDHVGACSGRCTHALFTNHGTGRGGQPEVAHEDSSSTGNNGLVTRVVFAEVPPRVEYKVTKLGEELLEQLRPVWLWTVANVNEFEVAQAKFSGKGRGIAWTQPRVAR